MNKKELVLLAVIFGLTLGFATCQMPFDVPQFGPLNVPSQTTNPPAPVQTPAQNYNQTPLVPYTPPAQPANYQQNNYGTTSDIGINGHTISFGNQTYTVTSKSDILASGNIMNGQSVTAVWFIIVNQPNRQPNQQYITAVDDLVHEFSGPTIVQVVDKPQTYWIDGKYGAWGSAIYRLTAKNGAFNDKLFVAEYPLDDGKMIYIGVTSLAALSDIVHSIHTV